MATNTDGMQVLRDRIRELELQVSSNFLSDPNYTHLRQSYDAEIANNKEYTDKIERELAWYRAAFKRYEARLEEQANVIHNFMVTAAARAQGREPTFAELISFRHIATERYEG